jgi:hypothetical protein
MFHTSLTKIGGGFGVSPAVEVCEVSDSSSYESAQKRFLVEVGCSQ